jgi:acetate---CoA ligase (ADP-forming)
MEEFVSLEKFFCPDSVAVIGASREEGKVGRTVLESIIDSKFKGKIYPINPKCDEIEGIRCYKSILDVEGDVDLAVIVIPAKYVLRVQWMNAQKKCQSCNRHLCRF